MEPLFMKVVMLTIWLDNVYVDQVRVLLLRFLDDSTCSRALRWEFKKNGLL